MSTFSESKNEIDPDVDALLDGLDSLFDEINPDYGVAISVLTYFAARIARENTDELWAVKQMVDWCNDETLEPSMISDKLH